MEFFQFCLEIINREIKKFNVSFDISGLKTFTVDSSDNTDYNLIKKRCHFLYRCGTINLYFAKVCFKTFLLDHKIVQDLLTKWNNCADLTFCSVSTGPALDYIAFLHSFQESEMIPPLFKNIKIVTKHGAWRNTTDVLHKIIQEGYLKSLPCVAIGKIKVFQGDPFKDFAKKIKSAISSSDVIMMMNRLNLKKVNRCSLKKISNYIKVFLDAIKPGAVLFCIDTQPSIKEITQLLNLLPGTFLLKPTFMSTVINFEYPIIKERVGCLPILSSDGNFFVWQKSCASNQSNASLSDIKNCDPQLANDTTDFLEYSGSHLPSTSAWNASDHLRRESQTIDLCSSGSATACTQTASDEILQETEAKKVMELSHRIEKLTEDITEILKNCESNTHKCLLSNDGIHSECSSAISCSKISDCIQNCEICCCDHHHSLSKCCFSCDKCKIKASSCEFKSSSFNNPPVNHSSIIYAQSNSLPSAQLVIPLTNLSADVVSQIVSLISQPKQNQENAASD